MIAGAPVPQTPSTAAAAATAEQLRAYLMALAPTAPLREGTAPHGLGQVQAAAPAVLLLAAPAWSDPRLRCLVRPEVAERLQRAAGMLPENLRLGFWEGLRPLAVQQALWRTGLEYLRGSYPHWSAADLE